jgi:hypothetical protein
MFLTGKVGGRMERCGMRRIEKLLFLVDEAEAD